MTTEAIAEESSGRAAPDRDTTYQAFLTVADSPHPVRDALGQVASWLTDKGYEVPDLTVSGFARVGAGADLVVVHRETRAAHTVRIRLNEAQRDGTEWVTTIALHTPEREDGWLAIRVGHTGGIPAKTPRVAQYLLQVLDVRDSDYRLVPGAPVVRPDGVEDLLDAVCDPHRAGLVFVAATDASNSDLFTAFADQVNRIARGVHGLGQVVVLDPAATEQFNTGIGATHAVPPWTIRTFSTAVDPAWAPDARRHRILSTQRLATDSDRFLTEILGRAARQHAANQSLPATVRTVLNHLNRLEDRLLLSGLYEPETAATSGSTDTGGRGSRGTDMSPLAEETEASGSPATDVPFSTAAGVSPRPPSPEPTSTGVGDEAAAYLATFEMVKRVLSVDDLTEESLQQALRITARTAETARARQETADRVSKELAERQRRIEELEDRLSEAREATDDALIEQRLAEDARVRAQDEARWLRRVLAEQGRHVEAHAAFPDEQATQVPGSFEDLLARLPELQPHGVVFTGDPKVTAGLDDQDTLGTIVSAAWECLLTLVDYIAAKQAGDYTGNLKQYVLNPPSGYRTVPAKRLGEKEYGTTLDRWGGKRVFPVPVEVDQAGEVLMEAHWKLPRCGMVTPRIHFHDYSHATGTVYVGYIGPHLQNRGTN